MPAAVPSMECSHPIGCYRSRSIQYKRTQIEPHHIFNVVQLFVCFNLRPSWGSEEVLHINPPLNKYFFDSANRISLFLKVLFPNWVFKGEWVGAAGSWWQCAAKTRGSEEVLSIRLLRPVWSFPSSCGTKQNWSPIIYPTWLLSKTMSNSCLFCQEPGSMK